MAARVRIVYLDAKFRDVQDTSDELDEWKQH
jgi:hypothetical protein